MKFVLATHNIKKLAELQRILEPVGVTVVSEKELSFDFPDVEETGTTFEENALLKAKSACEVCGLPAIADDSGLCVDALGGAPGVYSARYAGEDGNDAKNNQKLLDALKGIPDEQRTARFVSVVCCYFPGGEHFFVRGECEGVIAHEPHGDAGFGYDPLFIHDGRCFGQLSADEKDKVSHRGRALRALCEKLKDYLK
jgi:XTP/dITP diphosphohydrolase